MWPDCSASRPPLAQFRADESLALVWAVNGCKAWHPLPAKRHVVAKHTAIVLGVSIFVWRDKSGTVCVNEVPELYQGLRFC